MIFGSRVDQRLFFGDGNLKEFKTYEQQLDIMKSRGIIIQNDEYVIKALQEHNYYNLVNGYKDLFLQSMDEEDHYKENVTFEEIYALYRFDVELKRALLNKILIVEDILRSLIPYEFSKKHGNDNYLKFDSFDRLTEINAPYKTKQKRAVHIHELIASIQKTLAASISKKDYIEHYITQYGFVPLWVLINSISFGTLSKFYELMFQRERVAVAKYFHVLENELAQYIKSMSAYRNLCAHDERLYNAKLGKTCSIHDTKYHELLGIPIVNGRYAYGKNDVFSLIIALKQLLPHQEFINLFNIINHQIYRLESKLNSITIEEVYEKMGFPTTWRDIKKS